MVCSYVKPFHLPSPIFSYFPNNNINTSSPYFSKLVFPRIVSATAPLQVAANHHPQHDDQIEFEDEDDDIEFEDDEEYESPTIKFLEKIYSGEIPERRWMNVVYWDMDTAPLPSPELAPNIFENITCWLIHKSYFGPMKLVAYGDKNKVPSAVWDELLESRGTIGKRYVSPGAPLPMERVKGEFTTHVPSEGGVPSWCYILTDLAISTVGCPDINRIVISGDDRIRQCGVMYLCYGGYQVFAVQPSSSVVDVFAIENWIWEDVVGGGPLLPGLLESMEK